MLALDSVIFRELPVIHQIILNETWLEAERRGCSVYADDEIVRANVCCVVLRIGAELRETTQRELAGCLVVALAGPELPEAA